MTKKAYIPSQRNVDIAEIMGCSATNQKRIAFAVKQATTDGCKIEWLRVNWNKDTAKWSEKDKAYLNWRRSDLDNHFEETKSHSHDTKLEQASDINILQDSELTNTDSEINIHQDGSTVNDELNTTQNDAEFTTVNYGKGESRRTVQIEGFYIKALEHIGEKNVAQWLSNTIGTLPKQVKGCDKKRTGTAKSIKRAIIQALIAKIPQASA